MSERVVRELESAERVVSERVVTELGGVSE